MKVRLLRKILTKVYRGVDMHRCPNCGETVEEGDVFCRSCGARLSRKGDAAVIRDLAKVVALQEKIRSYRSGASAARSVGAAVGIITFIALYFWGRLTSVPLLILITVLVYIPFAILGYYIDRKAEEVRMKLEKS